MSSQLELKPAGPVMPIDLDGCYRANRVLHKIRNEFNINEEKMSMQHFEYKNMCMPYSEINQYMKTFVKNQKLSEDEVRWLKYYDFPIPRSGFNLLSGLNFKVLPESGPHEMADDIVAYVYSARSNLLVRNSCVDFEKDILPDYNFHNSGCECRKTLFQVFFHQSTNEVAGFAMGSDVQNDPGTQVLAALLQNKIMSNATISKDGNQAVLTEDPYILSHIIENISLDIDSIKYGNSLHLERPIRKMVDDLHYNLSANIIRVVGKITGEIKPAVSISPNLNPVWLNTNMEPTSLQVMTSPGEYSDAGPTFPATDNSQAVMIKGNKNIAIMFEPNSEEQLLYRIIG